MKTIADPKDFPNLPNTPSNMPLYLGRTDESIGIENDSFDMSKAENFAASLRLHK